MRYMCVYHLANEELGQLNYSVKGIKTNWQEFILWIKF